MREFWFLGATGFCDFAVKPDEFLRQSVKNYLLFTLSSRHFLKLSDSIYSLTIQREPRNGVPFGIEFYLRILVT